MEVIECDVRQGSKRDAKLASFSANANHGKRRTNADKRHAFTTMLADEEWGQWSSNQIAKTCEVHHSMVDRIRKEFSLSQSASDKPAERTFTDKHGNTSTMKVDNIGEKKRNADPVQEALEEGLIDQFYADQTRTKPSL